MILIAVRKRTRKIEKRSQFWLHGNGDLCIISMRPPPRWAKWSRGVRTRGLRVGLVGGPRPLFILGQSCFDPAIESSRDSQPIINSGRLTLRVVVLILRQALTGTLFGLKELVSV